MCPRCGHRRAYELASQRRWQCAGCRHQVSVTAGTILHRTKTPLTVWFWAAYLMTTDKRGVSALLLQRQLGLGRYETAWMMLHKFRRAMVNAAANRCTAKWKSMTPGSEALRPVCAEAANSKDGKRRWFWWRWRSAARLRARSHGGHPGLQGDNPARFPEENVAPGSTVYTDGLKSFAGLQEAGFKHVPRIQPLRISSAKGHQSVVPLADRAIGNLQQWLIGTYHGVSKDQLQVYLDEFVFRHNRRKHRWPHFRPSSALGPAAHRPIQTDPRGSRHSQNWARATTTIGAC